MKKIIIVLAFLSLLTSCDIKPKPVIYVDTKENVYIDLVKESDQTVEKLFQKIDSLEILKEFNKGIEIFESADEIEMITSIVNAAIEGQPFLDSASFERDTALLLENLNNFGALGTKFSTYQQKGYKVGFYSYCGGCTELYELKKEMKRNYKSKYSADSITELDKNYIIGGYNATVNRLENLDYIVITHDALLIKPKVVDDKNFQSGYLVTHIYIHDVNTLEKVGQGSVFSTNSDEISFMTYGKTSTINTSGMLLKLNNDLFNNRHKSINEYLSFKGEEGVQ